MRPVATRDIPSIRSRSSLVAFVVLAASVVLLVPPEFGRGASGCATDSRPAYQVTLCLTAPLDGASVSGDTVVTTSVTLTGSNPGVRRAVYRLGSAYLLTDFQAPYTFVLPSDHFVDGPRSLSVHLILRDGFTTSTASVSLTFANGVTAPPANTNAFQPSPGLPQQPGAPFVVAATGDGAGGETNADLVADLVESWNPNLFLYLGDVYEKGTFTEFQNWYGANQEFFGRFRPITNPTIGNHEYEGGVAPGYFFYWDNIPHHYSFDARGWHFVSLDSTSQFGQLTPGTGQYEWLDDDLARSASECTMVYFHHPVYSVGPQGARADLQPIWDLLVARGVDVVVTGHEHSYQRWHPLDADGDPDPSGITQFVVGTGGHTIQSFARSDPRLAAGFDSPSNSRGALRLNLNPSGASYAFLNIQGATLDSGSIMCGTAPDTTAPTPPNGLSATAPSHDRVELSWLASTDDVGVTGYTIYRDGSPIAATGPGTTYTDASVSAATTYRYEVQAFDASANASALSDPAFATTPAFDPVVFDDDFEDGSLAAWSSVVGNVTAQTVEARTGSWAARAVGSGSAAYALADLPQPMSEVYYRTWFRVQARGSSTLYLMKLRTPTNGSILGVYVAANGRLSYRNDVAGASTSSSTTVTSGVWHELQVRVAVGNPGQVSVWYDGEPVAALTKAEPLGGSPVGRLQLGENATGRSFDVVFDDVVASSQPVMPPSEPDTTAPSAPTGLVATSVTHDRVDLVWTAAADDVGVTGYTIYRDGSPIATTGPTTGYSDLSVVGGTTYGYRVQAFDAAANTSLLSDPAFATTPTAPSTLTLTPVADSYVDADSPTTIYGMSSSLRVDASPQRVSYLRFDVPPVNGQVTSAVLRIRATSSSSAGHRVWAVEDDSWGEATLNWGNAPPLGDLLGSSGPFGSGTWIEVDVSALVTGAGTYSLALTTPSSTQISYASRESATPPELVVDSS